MKIKVSTTVKLSDSESFTVEVTGIDQDAAEFRKDIRKMFLKKQAVKNIWREMQDEKTKDSKTTKG